MNKFVCLLMLAAVVAAEPPQYRGYYNRFARQELDSGSEKEATTARNDDAPYPAAGFKPTKEFNLPSRQEVSPPATSYGVPDDSYGAPLNTYSVPQTVYGVPEKAPETKTKDEDSKENEGADSAETESKEINDDKAKLEAKPKKEAEVVNSQGVYYVLLPGSQLQRVQFQTENDLSNMAYTARLQYRNEDRAPLYVYTAVPQYQSAAYVQLY